MAPRSPTPQRNRDDQARRLRERFARVPIGVPPARLNARRSAWAIAAVGALIVSATGLVLAASPWPLQDTLKHIGAVLNCSTARALGVDRARVGQPGYYERHDEDRDGIACEPVPGPPGTLPSLKAPRM
jgi:hypothetical protein